MLSCHQATRLLSESQERELSTKEKVGLKFHTAMCSGCRNFGKNVETLREAMQVFASGKQEEKADNKKASK